MNIFTSESVSSGHPDKICDQISDAVLDACLTYDPDSHVACEVFATGSLIIVGGEISSTHTPDVDSIVRRVVKDIGYDHQSKGLDYNTLTVMNLIRPQSPDINQGVIGEGIYKGQQGAGDQGIMFGFACNDTPSLMPAPIVYAHALIEEAEILRKSDKDFAWMRPDAKSQISIVYDDNGVPVRIDSVVFSQQHDENISHEDIKRNLYEELIKPILQPSGLLDDDTKIIVNPTGRFVTGGTAGDTGLTGRKIIVDTYGGMGRHGGGALSGKDPSKVDRSGAYMARYIAKNIVDAGMADRAEVQLGYAIGVPFPVSLRVDTFGTEKIPTDIIVNAVQKVFDCTPAGIIKTLDLKRPIYLPTAVHGHFGNRRYTWEETNRVNQLLECVK